MFFKGQELIDSDNDLTKDSEALIRRPMCSTNHSSTLGADSPCLNEYNREKTAKCLSKSFQLSLATLSESIDLLKRMSFFPESPTTEKEGGFPPNRFLEEIDPYFLCFHCKKVVNCPRECKYCQLLFCYQCVTRNTDCPTGCPRLSYRKPSPFIQSYYAKLRVKCQHYNNGCFSIETTHEIHSHQLTCDYSHNQRNVPRQTQHTHSPKTFIPHAVPCMTTNHCISLVPIKN